MYDPSFPTDYVRPKRKSEPPHPNVKPVWVTVPVVVFTISVASGGSVLLGRFLVWWLPFMVAAIFFFGPLLTNEPLRRRISLSIAGASTVALSYATIPLFMLLFEWDWYERHFNDKGSGLLGFFIFTCICVVLPAYMVYRCLMSFPALSDSEPRVKMGEPSDAPKARASPFSNGQSTAGPR